MVVRQRTKTPLKNKASLKQAVIADVERVRKLREETQEKRKQEQRRRLNRKWSLSFPKRVNMNKYFYFPNIFDRHYLGKPMTKSAIAVYTVLCSRADFEIDTSRRISQTAIAAMAGTKIETARRAIGELVNGGYDFKSAQTGETLPLLQIDGGMKGNPFLYKYRPAIIRDNTKEQWRDQYFTFYTCIVDDGTWAKLTPRAKCLYLAALSMAEQDWDLYSAVEDTRFEDYQHYLTSRQWDTCKLSKSELCRVAGIGRANLRGVIESLEGYGLMEFLEPGLTKVYFRPKGEEDDQW